MSQEHEFTDPKTMETFEKIEKEFNKFFLLEDQGICRLFMAAVVANRLPQNDPVWLFLVAPSSGGKTEFINSIEKLPFVFGIDTLTVNTFASGQQRVGKETSLLHKLPGNEGIFTFKDFTTIVDMNPMARKEIMGQLRAIFDNKFEKRTGTGEDIKWKGKVGMIAGITSVVHNLQSEFASMGERFMQYEIRQPNRREVQKMVLENKKKGGMTQIRNHLQDCVLHYMNTILPIIEAEAVEANLSQETQDDIFEVADLVTRARSGIERSMRTNNISFIPDVEMPTRVTGQLSTLAMGFVAMRNAEKIDLYQMRGGPETLHDSLTEEEKDLIYKVALDSIPRKRRQALQALTLYKSGVTSAGLAIKLNYPTDTIKDTLEELNALGFCDRVRDGGTNRWVLRDEMRPTMIKFEHIKPIEEALRADDGTDEDYTEQKAALDEAFERDFGSADAEEDKQKDLDF